MRALCRCLAFAFSLFFCFCFAGDGGLHKLITVLGCISFLLVGLATLGKPFGFHCHLRTPNSQPNR